MIFYHPDEAHRLILERRAPLAMNVMGDLYFNDCDNLINLPDGLTVLGDLWCAGCIGLAELPEGLVVGEDPIDDQEPDPDMGLRTDFGTGDFWLNDCVNLTTICGDLIVHRTLYLDRCTSLTALPENLKIKGDLSLTGCAALSALPKGLRIGGHLWLDGRTSLNELPADLKCAGDIFLENTTIRYDTIVLHQGLPASIIAAMDGRAVGDLLEPGILREAADLDARVIGIESFAEQQPGTILHLDRPFLPTIMGERLDG